MNQAQSGTECRGTDAAMISRTSGDLLKREAKRAGEGTDGDDSVVQLPNSPCMDGTVVTA